MKYTAPDGREDAPSKSNKKPLIQFSVGFRVALIIGGGLSVGVVIEAVVNFPARIENAIFNFLGIPNQKPLLELDGQ